MSIVWNRHLAATALGGLLVVLLSASNARADILYASDQGNSQIMKFDSAGNGSVFAGSSSGLSLPIGIAFDPAGNLFVTTSSVTTQTIAKLTPAGAGSTFGSLTAGTALAFDGDSTHLYGMNLGEVRKYDASTGGAGTSFVGQGGYAMAFDSGGNLFIATRGGSHETIYKVTPAGVKTTFYDNATGAPGALLAVPDGLAFDSSGNLFVANYNFISKFTPNGQGSIFASGGLLSEPAGLAFDSGGNLYVANSLGTPLNEQIVRYTPAGVGSVFVAHNAQLNDPYYLAFTDDAGHPLRLANQVNAPEPSSLALSVIASTSLMRRRNRTPKIMPA